MIERGVFAGIAVVACVALGVVACDSDDGKPAMPPSTLGDASALEGTANVDAASDAGATDPTKKKNAEVGCASNEECASNVCFTGGQQSFCSVTCTVDNAATVCAAPFTGTCNRRGFCKRD